jgi:hypothetical protein
MRSGSVVGEIRAKRKGSMPIRIGHHDINAEVAQQVDIDPLRHQARLFSKPSYTATETMLGVLYESI